MLAKDIRQEYLDFFKAKDHVEIPAAPLIPKDDSTTLFTSSGMQQLVPYLKGKAHPMGKRLVDSQPSFRAEDIEEIGDNRHTTFFEMLGNWSLGDYFKQEQLAWVWQFFTQVLQLDPHRLHVTVFAGSAEIPKDEEAYQIWRQLGVPDSHIHWYGPQKNWWSRAGEPNQMPPGEIGGPDSEIFYDFGETYQFHQHSAFKNQPCHVNCDCGRYLEIGNSVFMQYEKQSDGSFKPLPNRNVDFGGGLERLAAVTQGVTDIFQIDIFKPVIDLLVEASGKDYAGSSQPPMRIIADHLRAAAFMVGQGVYPSNKMQGYLLRRLLRRATLKAKQLAIPDIPKVFAQIVAYQFNLYQPLYFPQAELNQASSVINQEISKFERALKQGLKHFRKLDHIDGKVAFDLLQTYGFPLELTLELAQERGQQINLEEFKREFSRHQQKSRTASKGLFKGGLADHSQKTIAFHTATHLLHQALRTILGPQVHQIGSNITPERLRFDFTFDRKLTPEELQQIEALINQKIAEDLPVFHTIEPKEKALASGALAFFNEKYPDKVSVYTIGRDPEKDWFSKELCGGPHVSSTAKIGNVRIKKEEGLGSGKRRLYLVFADQSYGNKKPAQ